MSNDDRRLIEDYLPIEASRANSPPQMRRGGAPSAGVVLTRVVLNGR